MIGLTDIESLDDFDPNSVDSSDPFHTDDSEDGYYQNDDLESTFDFYGITDNEFVFEDSDIDNTESLLTNSGEDINETALSHSHYRSSSIVFTGNGRCRVCNCGGWAGFGDTCANCGHFYNKHI